MVESLEPKELSRQLKQRKKAKNEYPYEFTTEQQRLNSVNMPDNIAPDELLAYLLKNAEVLYEIKKVYTDQDWLKVYPEKGQLLRSYQWNQLKNNKVTKTCNKILLYFLDNTIDEQSIAKLRLYCEAFFLA